MTTTITPIKRTIGMSKSVSATDVDFDISVGDVVGCRRLISGYGNRDWLLIEAEWYGDGISDYEPRSYSCDNRCWRHCGRARITRITKKSIFFEFCDNEPDVA